MKKGQEIVMGYVSYPNPFLGYWKAQYIFHNLPTNTHITP